MVTPLGGNNTDFCLKAFPAWFPGVIRNCIPPASSWHGASGMHEEHQDLGIAWIIIFLGGGFNMEIQSWA